MNKTEMKVVSALLGNVRGNGFNVVPNGRLLVSEGSREHNVCLELEAQGIVKIEYSTDNLFIVTAGWATYKPSL